MCRAARLRRGSLGSGVDKARAVRFGGGVLVFGVVAAAYMLAYRPEVSMKVISAECGPYYGSAHTALDTNRIDRMYPPSQTKAPNAFTCGAVRAKLHATH